VKKDLDAGIDLTKAYGEALTRTELEWLLSLGNLMPKARLTLEESLKKYPEYSLEQLYMLSLFPVVQQESLVERFKTPIVLHVLRQTLAPFLPEKNQNAPSTKENVNYQPYNQTTNTNQTINDLSKNVAFSDKTPFSNEHTNTGPYFDPKNPAAQSSLPQNLRQNIFEQSNHLTNTSNIIPTASVDPTTTATADRVQEPKREKTKAQTALLIVVSYTCNCGCHYSVNFKNGSIVVQKQNLICDYVDFKPRTFQVYCDKCNSDHEFTVEGIEADEVQIFCRRCKPQPREGLLNINSGEVTWHDN
jgi:hypothetical protein